MDNKRIIEVFGKPGSRIVSYEGLEGIREISRHSLEARDGLAIFEMSYASLNDIFGRTEAEEIRKEFLRRQIKIREITNKAYYEYTDVTEFDRKCMEIRFISPKKVNLQTEFLIYNDVVAFYSYGQETFAVEIYNAEFARTQQQIFDRTWAMADRPVLGRNGRTSIF